MEGVLGDLGLEIFPEVQMLRYQCGCTADRMADAIKMLGQAELQDMLEKDKGAEVTCDFCGDVYRLDDRQLGEMIAEMTTS
jgi:molecular chaperone Hsp33